MVPTYLKPFNQIYIQGQAMNPTGKTLIPDSETHLTTSKNNMKTAYHRKKTLNNFTAQL